MWHESLCISSKKIQKCRIWWNIIMLQTIGTFKLVEPFPWTLLSVKQWTRFRKCLGFIFIFIGYIVWHTPRFHPWPISIWTFYFTVNQFLQVSHPHWNFQVIIVSFLNCSSYYRFLIGRSKHHVPASVCISSLYLVGWWWWHFCTVN